ncbi:MAG: T9SS type A sorting domain-containing protein [Sphingobacteriales bacterium JAD_PAG50586_3]|nr:MAG: T9SS type A sorting domain-containing protein [Sphingobacteriales bacterium JAD_PAG50586_3]
MKQLYCLLLFLFASVALGAQTTNWIGYVNAQYNRITTLPNPQNITYTTGDPHTITLGTTNGWVSLSSRYPFGYETVALPENTANVLVSAYPNPANDFIYISLAENKLTFVQVYSSLGSIVYNALLTNTPIDISAFSQGLYSVRLIQDNKVVKTFKVTKL